MGLFGSKTTAPDLPSNELPCPVFPPVPQMDPISHRVMGFSPTPCFSKQVGCAWAVGGTCSIYLIGSVCKRVLALLEYLASTANLILKRFEVGAVPPIPAPDTAPVGSKTDTTPAQTPAPTEGNA